MRSIFKLVLGVGLTLSASAFANNKVGNGGNVVRCQRDGKPSLVLLDFYESETKPKFSSRNHREIAEEVLKNLKTAAPKLADQYLKRLSQIENEIAFKEDIELLEVPDSKHLFRPLSKACEVLQVAVRNNLAPSTEKRFLIRKDLWNQMEPEQKAGLLLHEILHEHLTKLGEENSIKARRINSLLFSNNWKPAEFWKLVQELEVPIYP